MTVRKLFSLFLLLLSTAFYGQGDRVKDKKQQIKAMKVAFLTTELEFTTAEAEKFWPLYNAFDDKQFELRQQKMKSYFRRLSDGVLDKMTEKEASLLLIQIETTDEELFVLRKKFMASLKNILPSVKIIKMRKLEEDFNRKLLHQYRDKRQKEEN